ncbi:ATP-binding protein related resistance protein [Thermoplasma acidophilum]|uniref:ATP-binding protein related resistance protein n=1 Tax=Thermoplasma acidophilum (strain ATCC 25905 / DSM 1728 / JCM 9062 / NBRC 15155 / AMRC-C165) TaxID=273075 RepID=Q9HK71_THEAC|nr:ABC transporter ATP-binding protein [Thermoplasma acidophilum]CAC11868.1 ATP-binding protein related resistance protein [Thermoplasma acidophilum]
MENGNLLEVRNLSKIYPGGSGVRNASIKIRYGSIHALLGNNGAGKSTTMKCITGLLEPDSIEISFRGTTYPWNSKDLKKHIGYVPELPAFPKVFTVHDCIVSYGRMMGLGKAEAVGRAMPIVSILGLEEHMKKRVSSLSRGMLQKLDIVIALLSDPDVIIMDEPTAGLDVSAVEELFGIIRSLRDRGKSILISSHQLRDIETISDSVTVMDSGHVIFDGSIKDLYASAGSVEVVAEFSRIDGKLMETIKRMQGVMDVRMEDVPNRISIAFSGSTDPCGYLRDLAFRDGVSLISCSRSQSDLRTAFIRMVEYVRGQRKDQ